MDALRAAAEAALMQGLAVKAKDRIQDMASLQQGLRQPDRVQAPTPPEPPEPPRPAPARPRSWGLCSGAVSWPCFWAYLGYQDHDRRSHQDADTRAFDRARGTDTYDAYRAYPSACAADGCAHRAQAEQRAGEALRATAPNFEDL